MWTHRSRIQSNVFQHSYWYGNCGHVSLSSNQINYQKQETKYKIRQSLFAHLYTLRYLRSICHFFLISSLKMVFKRSLCSIVLSVLCLTLYFLAAHVLYFSPVDAHSQKYRRYRLYFFLRRLFLKIEVDIWSRHRNNTQNGLFGQVD